MEDEELIQQIEWLQQAEDDERREEDQSWQVLLALAGAVIAGAELSAERRRLREFKAGFHEQFWSGFGRGFGNQFWQVL